jgi:CheY-like chemotaxis protein
MGGAPRKRAKVLVVDDEAIMRELLRLHLGSNGYDVVLAEDAVAAGHLVVRETPDLILVDVEMPYMNGYEFVAALKSDPATRHIPVVFLTTLDGVAEEARKLGAAAYLNKPVMADRLLEVVAACVKR